MNKNKKPLTLFRLISNRAPKLLAFSMILGLVAGACYSFIIPFLLHGLELNQGANLANEGIEAGNKFSSIIDSHYIGIYFLICTAIVAARAISLIIVNVIVKDVSADLRINLCKKINRANVRDVETMGLSRLINILMDDINNISFAAVCMPMMCIEAVTILGLMSYLAYMDVRVFLFILAAVVIGTSMFHFPMRLSSKYMDKSRSVRDQVQGGIRGILFGLYELKLNREKAREYIESEIAEPERRSVKLDKTADAIMHSAGNFGTLLSFLIIGLVAFVLPELITFSSAHTYGIVMVLLYLIGPISMLLNLLPNVQRGNVALSRVVELTKLSEEPAGKNDGLAHWKEYSIRDVEYHYENGASEHENGFSLKATTLKFKPGEVAFIVGGNGSGKSTLGKILSLHYKPANGVIEFDSTEITNENIENAREKIAVIYSNYFLFNKLYKNLSDEEIAKTESWLKLLKLDHKTQVIDGEFTTTDLSDGQKRRLALMVALLEDREIYIFDEWAADQDPEFKNAFYTEIVPEMRNQGKLVIVITHDDRYFNCADRVIQMEDGAVRQVTDYKLDNENARQTQANQPLEVV